MMAPVDAMAPEAITPLLVVLLLVLLYQFIGSGVMKRSRAVNFELSDPLHTLITGLAVWVAVGTLLLPLDAPLIVLFSCVTGVGVLYRLVAKRGLMMPADIKEQNRMLPFALLLTCLPILLAAATAIPLLSDEWQFWAVPASLMDADGSMPSAQVAQAFSAVSLQYPPAWWLALAPLQEVSDVGFSPMGVVFNVFLVVFALLALTRLSGVRIRWSNLPLIVSGTALGIVLLNPFLSWQTLFSVRPDIVAAAALLVYVAPLLSQKPLPPGVQALPTALGGLLFALSAPEAVYFIPVVTFLWLLHVKNQPTEFRRKCASAAVYMFFLPFFGVAAWRNMVSGVWPWEWAFETPVMPVGLELAAVLFSIFLLGVLLVPRWRAWLTVPEDRVALTTITALLFTYWGVRLVGQPVTPSLFMFLVPLAVWKLVLPFYAESRLQRYAFQSPWLIGMALIGVWVAVQFFWIPIVQSPSAPLLHVKNVGEVLPQYAPKGARIAVWDSVEADNVAAALNYFAPPQYDIMSLAPWLNQPAITRPPLHKVLTENGVQLLWLHVSDAPARAELGASFQPHESYLLNVTPHHFVLNRAFAHPRYQVSGLGL